MNTTKRLDFLDGLRAVAALYVVFHHASLMVAPEAQYAKFISYLYRITGLGHEAVDVFIVLSGISLMISVVRNGGRLKGTALTFYLRRAWRILPPYYAALVLSMLLGMFLLNTRTGGWWDIALPVTTRHSILHALLIHDLFRDSVGKINTALWSVAVEWRIYLVFPLIVLLVHRYGVKAVAALLVVSALLLIGINHFVYEVTRVGPSPQYLGLFAMGCWGTMVMLSSPAVSPRVLRMPYGILAVVLGLVGAVNAVIAPNVLGVWNDYLVGAATVCGCIYLSQKPGSRASRLLSCKPLTFLGLFSYSIYLIHMPVQQLVLQYGLMPLGLSYPVTVLILMLLGSPLLILVAYGFFQVIERRFLSYPHQLRIREKEAV